MKSLNLAVLSLAMSALACGDDDGGSSGENACDYIVGNSYSSIDELECGAGRSPCQWQLSFNADMTYEYRYSDQVNRSGYSCSGLSIMRETASGASTAGTYNVETAIVTWDGVDFQ